MNDFAKIEEIYHHALEKKPDEREAFLREVCAGNAELCREVESLLSFDEDARSFIESPPDDLAAAVVGLQNTESLIGKTVNHYCVISLLGAGGMGEVYLAEDTKLGRKVALKLLPPKLSSHPERKRRFEQEARATSSLNHPNIITIYGFEHSNELDFITTEFIDGENLRERFAREPLSVTDTLDIAIQISSALEAAHSVGVIHRDIKPANIMLRRDRIAKILDFGLAKLTADNNSNSFETKDLTGQNCVMGTINYMSPEQALGETLDVRTDIFSLGVVLYEMLIGIQPFKGNSEAAIYNHILNKKPAPPSKIKKSVPPDLEEIVIRAMEKDAKKRFQNAADLRVALEKVKRRINSGETVRRSLKKKTKNRRNKTAIFAGAIFVVLLATGFLFFFSKSHSGAAAVKNISYQQLTKSTGAEMFPSLAPDGKSFIYSSRAGGNWNVYFQRVGEINSSNLTKNSTANNLQAVYSPDGNQIAFRSDRNGGGIFLMDADGENVKRLTNFGFYPSWSPDGKAIVFCTEDFEDPMNRGVVSYLWTVNITDGERRKLTDTQDAIQPNWSPNGARIAFWGYHAGSAQRDLWTISAGGDALVEVTNDTAVDWNPVWSPDGKYLYFASDRGGSMNLWRVAVNENTGEVTSETESISTPSVYSEHLTFSRDGSNFAYVESVNYSNIVKADFDATGEKATIENQTELTPSSMLATNPELSPDGERIAFDNIGDEQEDIFLMKSDGTEIRRLTNDNYKDRTPKWSPDGKQIAFFSDRTGKYQGWTMNPDGSNLTQVTQIAENKWAQLPVWSPDGGKLLYNRNFAVPIILDASNPPLINQTPPELAVENPTNFWIMMSDWSPDGKKLIGYTVSNGEGKSGIFEYLFDTRRYEKVTDFGSRCVWLNDNRRALFVSKDKIYLLDTQTKKLKEILSVAPNRLNQVSISKDNRAIFYPLQKTESDVWLADFK